MDSNPEFPPMELAPLPPELGTPVPPDPLLENPPWNGWVVLRMALVLFVVPLLVIGPIAVFVPQKTLYKSLSFQAVLHKSWILLSSQFGWYVVAAFYMEMFVEGTYHQHHHVKSRDHIPAKL